MATNGTNQQEQELSHRNEAFDVKKRQKKCWNETQENGLEIQGPVLRKGVVKVLPRRC